MTRGEVFQEVLRCYKEYYMRKLPQWVTMRGQEFKRRCLLNGMKAILENSFLKDHMKGLGKMPGEIQKLLSTLGLLGKPSTGQRTDSSDIIVTPKREGAVSGVQGRAGAVAKDPPAAL